MNYRSYNGVDIKKQEVELAVKDAVYKSVNGMSLEPSAPKQALLSGGFDQQAQNRIRNMVRELGDQAQQFNSCEL